MDKYQKPSRMMCSRSSQDEMTERRIIWRESCSITDCKGEPAKFQTCLLHILPGQGFCTRFSLRDSQTVTNTDYDQCSVSSRLLRPSPYSSPCLGNPCPAYPPVRSSGNRRCEQYQICQLCVQTLLHVIRLWLMQNKIARADI
jgi:hypothetical protein